MKSARRKFLRDASLTVTGAVLVSRLQAHKNVPEAPVAVSCAPPAPVDFSGTISSAQSGLWSDPATWGGSVPGPSDKPQIQAGHTVVYDLVTSTIDGAGISAGAVLEFDSSQSTLLQSTANIIVEGLLRMVPSSSSVIQSIRFTGINEDNFVGGGMVILDSDIGLWVMGSGQLDLQGAAKTSWTRVTGSVAAAAGSITVESSNGWKPGDEICIAPTEPPSVGTAFNSGFDQRVIKSISGNVITLDKATSRAHPMVNNQWTAEVMNLTRNVRIEGTAGGHAHIFIRSAAPQSVKYIAIRYMGPRKDRNSDGIKELVAGRYGLHFHHCNDGSRGSTVVGNVVRNTGNHSYVPHASHGITLQDNVAYDVTEIAFWWDPGDLTHNVLYDHNIVALCRYVPGSLNMNAEDAPTFSSSGFLMTTGDDNVCQNCVVVGGALGDVADGGGYNWEATLHEGVWTFTGNMAHNNDNGLRVWQNSTKNHVIEDFTAYHNGTAIFHGAYANSYTYNGGILYGNTMTVKAASVNSNRVRIENFVIDGANEIDHGIEVIHSPLPGDCPVFVRNVTIRNCRVAALLDSAEPEVHSTDLIQCAFSGAIVLDPNSAPGETIRVQPVSGSPYQITHDGQSGIAPFAPSIWGTGKGLKGEYFNSTDFTNPAFTRIDSNVSFSEWSSGVHHLITSDIYSVRWTGQIQPQYSESFTFFLGSGGGHRLWINNQLLLDSWEEHYPDVYQSLPITLQAGQLYDIRLEYFNTDAKTGMGLFWQSKSLPLEYVPQSQLYFSGLIGPPPGGQPPIANAGSDITIILPLNRTTLNGSASRDPAGSALSYAWIKLSGPSLGSISSPASAITSVTGLVEGIYVFRLKVTNTDGLTAQDDMVVTVKAAGSPGNPDNQSPVAIAGSDITLVWPVQQAVLDGSASYDPDGSITSYTWTKLSGPNGSVIADSRAKATRADHLEVGTYVFQLLVTDTGGASATDEIRVIVKPANTPDEVKPLNVTVAPNPTRNVFRISISSDSNLPISLRIFHNDGKLVQRFSDLSNEVTVRAGASFTRGVYFAMVEQGRQRKTVTLLKV